MFKTLFNKIGWAILAVIAVIVIANMKTPSREIGCSSPELLEELNRSIIVDSINTAWGWLPPEEKAKSALGMMKRIRFVATHIETISGDSNSLLCQGVIKTTVPGKPIPDDSEYDLSSITKYTVQKTDDGFKVHAINRNTGR